jgi:hypothetical protein
MQRVMELGIDLIASLRDRIGSPLSQADAPVFDWAGLHARLAAGHAARRQLCESDSQVRILAGGFADWKALHDEAKASRDVNRTDSTDRKAAAGIKDGIAGQVNAGGRGQ